MNPPLRLRAVGFSVSILFTFFLGCPWARTAPYLELAPMLGHTTSTNAFIWVKASESAKFSVRIGTKPELSDSRTVRGPKLETKFACMDHLVVGELQPLTRYFY